MRVQQQEEHARLKEMILYVAQRCRGESCFDIVRLCTVLFYVDYWAYSDMGGSVTGAQYVMRNGKPAPRGILGVLQEMHEAGDIRLETDELRPVPLREPDLEAFSHAQVSFVDGVIDKL